MRGRSGVDMGVEHAIVIGNAPSGWNAQRSQGFHWHRSLHHDSRMKWLLRDVTLALLGLSAAAGVAGAGVSLYRALTAVRALVSVGTVGTKALSGMEYEAQERRRTLLEVLAVENALERRIRSAQARRVGAGIARHSQELLDLNPSGRNRAKIVALRDNWQSYMDLRERVISLALEEKITEARTLAEGPTRAAFERSFASIQALQKSLDDFSARQEATIRAGLTEAVTECAFCALASVSSHFVCRRADLEPSKTAKAPHSPEPGRTARTGSRAHPRDGRTQ